MTKGRQQDPHAKSVAAFLATRDWTALLRHWIVHRYDRALVDALTLVRERAGRHGKRWDLLADCLMQLTADSIQPIKALPSAIREGCNREERLALDLVFLFSRARLCELASTAPIESQKRLFKIGIRGATQAVRLSRRIHDPALAATFGFLQARASAETGKLRQALVTCAASLSIYQRLYERNPGTWRAPLSRTLEVQGIIQRRLNDFFGSKTSLRRCVAFDRRLANASPKLHRLNLVNSLNNLGRTYLELGFHKQALRFCKEAVLLSSVSARERQVNCRAQHARSLYNYSLCQVRGGALEKAQAGLQRSIAIYRRLADHQPHIYRPDLAVLLSYLGYVQSELNLLHDSLTTYQQAVWIYRRLAKSAPGEFDGDLAANLSQLANTQRELTELEDSAANAQEAVDICRNLVTKSPQKYQPTWRAASTI
jgi:tetratricopeptide (TPR) repeat protein